MTFNQIFSSVVSIVLIAFIIFSLYEIYIGTKNIDYVFYAECMLLKAISDYRRNCIKEHVDPLVDYDDIMEHKEACNLYTLNWKDYINPDKLEILKPYLPEDPEKYIKQAMKKRSI